MPRKVFKKVQQNEVMNILQTWTHSLLYHKNMYPPKAFQKRDILGIGVYVASSPPLKKYLDTFFKELLTHLNHLNHLQILIMNKYGVLLEVNTLYIDSLETELLEEEKDKTEETSMGRVQKDIEMKGFLAELMDKLKQGFVRN